MLPSWVALGILTREFIVSGIRMVAASQGVVIAASWYGKAKTVAQIVAIVLFIVKDSVVITDPQGVLHNPLYLVSWLAMLIALALTVISMLDYFVKAKEILGFAPSGKRAKRRAGAGEAAAADAGEDESGGRADASLTCARCCHFPGTREEVRLLAVRAALEFALEALETR